MVLHLQGTETVKVTSRPGVGCMIVIPPLGTVGGEVLKQEDCNVSSRTAYSVQ